MYPLNIMSASLANGLGTKERSSLVPTLGVKGGEAPCREAPYPWKSSSAKKSPFRTLKNAKAAERRHKAGQSIGFTALASLKSQGRLPRADGCYVLGAKYAKGKGTQTRKTRR